MQLYKHAPLLCSPSNIHGYMLHIADWFELIFESKFIVRNPAKVSFFLQEDLESSGKMEQEKKEWEWLKVEIMNFGLKLLILSYW